MGCSDSEENKSIHLQNEDVVSSEGSWLNTAKKAAEKQDVREFRRSLNEIKKLDLTSEEVAFFLELWTNSSHTKFYDRSEVRVEVADVLVQAINNGRLKKKKDEFRDYVKPLIFSEDDDLARRAILVVGMIGGDDVADLRKIIQKEDGGTFYAASIALAMSCDISVNIEIEILRDIKDKKFAHEFKVTRQDYADYRKIRCK